MTFRIEFTEGATIQVEQAVDWWRANRRSGPDLFDDELAYALDLLAPFGTRHARLRRLFRERAIRLERPFEPEEDGVQEVHQNRGKRKAS